tara:strand:+ start:868 stop:1122 length:255 start_codon:yes stop_codon:yes gene_type:complete
MIQESLNITKTLLAEGLFLCYDIPMKNTEDVVMHPLWGIPVMLMFMVVLIQTLHTLTHWHMQIDADAYCRNNAEWIESNTNDDY